MIDAKISTKWEGQKVAKALNTGMYNNLGHYAGSIRLVAQRSIRKVKKGQPSRPGQPPHTHDTGKGGIPYRLRESIHYNVDRQWMVAVVGPSESWVGGLGRLHEFGGVWASRRKRRGPVTIGKYPARPFMAPAAQYAVARLPSQWQTSFTST